MSTDTPSLSSTAVRQGEAMYWYRVMTNIKDRSYIDELNQWYNKPDGHVNDHMAVPGINHSWRIHEVDDPHNWGPSVQEFSTIYQCDRLSPFQMRWTPLSEKTVQSEDRRKASTVDWIKVLYAVRVGLESDALSGKYWVREAADFDGSEEDKAAFEEYSAAVYLPAVLALPGVHRGWQLHHEPDVPGKVGEGPSWEYLNVFEVDAPEDYWSPRDGERPDWATSPFASKVIQRGGQTAELIFEMYAEDADPSLVVEWKMEPNPDLVG